MRAALALGDEPIEDLVELVESRFGVDVSLEPLPEALHGVFITDPTPTEGDGRVSVMLVNSTDLYGRQRFTLAHELAHLLFNDADLYWADYRQDDGLDLTELRANRFASAFLMPVGGVRALMSEWEPSRKRRSPKRVGRAARSGDVAPVRSERRRRHLPAGQP